MNTITEDLISFKVIPTIPTYREGLKIIFKPIARQHKKIFFWLSFFNWLIIIALLVILLENTEIISRAINGIIGKTIMFNYLCLAGIFITFIVYSAVNRHFLLKFFYSQSDYLQHSYQFIATKDGLNCKMHDNSANSEFSWYWVKAIELDKLGTLVVNIGGVNVIAMPKETFKNEEQRQQVFNQLTTWHNNAKTTFT